MRPTTSSRTDTFLLGGWCSCRLAEVMLTLHCCFIASLLAISTAAQSQYKSVLLPPLNMYAGSDSAK